jgi:DNA repair exonuclease SbcCD ATPase subunit
VAISEALKESISAMTAFMNKPQWRPGETDGLEEMRTQLAVKATEEETIRNAVAPEVQKELQAHVADIRAQIAEHKNQIAELQKQLPALRRLCQHDWDIDECIYCGVEQSD